MAQSYNNKYENIIDITEEIIIPTHSVYSSKSIFSYGFPE